MLIINVIAMFSDAHRCIFLVQEDELELIMLTINFSLSLITRNNELEQTICLKINFIKS